MVRKVHALQHPVFKLTCATAIAGSWNHRVQASSLGPTLGWSKSMDVQNIYEGQSSLRMTGCGSALAQIAELVLQVKLRRHAVFKIGRTHNSRGCPSSILDQHIERLQTLWPRQFAVALIKMDNASSLCFSWQSASHSEGCCGS